MASQFGVGAKTGETDAGTPQYEHGKVTVTNAVIGAAVEHYPDHPIRQAVGMLLLEGVPGDDDGE